MSASNQTRKHQPALPNSSPERSDQQTTQDEDEKKLPLTVVVGEGKSPLQTQTEAVSSALLSSTPSASHHQHHHHQQHHHLPAVYHCEEGIIQLVDTGCNNEDTLSNGEGAGPAAARSGGAAAATSDSGSSQGSTLKHGSAMMINRAAPPLSPSGGGMHAAAPTSLLRHAHRVSSSNLISSADATPAISINDEKRIVFPTSTRHPANPRPHITTNTTSSPHINSVGIFPSPVSLGIHPHPHGGGGGGHFAAAPKHKASNSQTGSMAASLTAISSSCVGMSSNCVGVTGLAIPGEGITSGFPSPPLGGSCTTPTAGLRNVPHLMRCSSSTPFDISTTSTTSANCCHPPLGFVVGESPSLLDDSTGSRSMASSLTYNVSAASFTGVVTPLPIAAAASAIPQANKANSAAQLLLPPPTTMAVGSTQEDFTNPLNSIATERKKTDHEAAEAPQLSSTLPPFVAATAVRDDSTEDFPIEFPSAGGDSRCGSMSGNSSTLSLGVHDNAAFAQKTSLTQKSTQRRENTLPPVSPSISPRASSVGPNCTPRKKSSDGNIKSCDKKATSSGGKRRTSVSTSSAAVNSSFSIDAASANDEVAVHNINFNAVQQCFFGYTGPQHQIGGGSVAAPLTPAAATTISSLTERRVDAQEQDAETETNVLTAAAGAGSIDDSFISPIPFAIEDRDRPPGFKLSPQKKQKERNNKAQTMSDNVIATAAPSIASVLELNNSAMNEGNHRRQPPKSMERSSQLTAVGDAHQRCSSECCESSDSVMQNEDLNTAFSDTAAKNNSSSNSNSGDVIKKEDDEQSGSTAEVLSPLPARQHHTDPTALARPRKK